MDATTLSRLNRKIPLSWMALAACAVLLTGCGRENLSERPYIMTCKGKNMILSGDDHPSRMSPHMAGIEMPNFQQIFQDLDPAHRHFRRELGFTREQTALETHVATLPISNGRYRYAYRNTNKLVSRPTAFDDHPPRHEPVGSMTVSHYYLDTQGELHPVDDFHIPAIDIERARFGQTMHRHVAATLPHDAAYAVYHITAEADPHWAPLKGNRPATQGQPGYWVVPLEESHRYRPYHPDTEHGEFHERPLGPYVGVHRQRHYAEEGHNAKLRHMYYLHTHHRRADREVDTVPCLMQPGDAYAMDDWFDMEAEPNEAGFYPPLSGPGRAQIRTGNELGLYFVGDRDALNDLPSNPSRFQG